MTRLKLCDFPNERMQHALRVLNVTTLEELCEVTERDLIRIPNVGRKTLNMFKQYLHDK